MSDIFMFSGIHTNSEKIAEKISSITGYRIILDEELIEEAGKKYAISAEKIKRAVFGKASVFNKFTHEKERCTAYLKSVLANHMKKDNCIYYGFAGHCIPEKITHVLKVLVIDDMKHRVSRAVQAGCSSEKEALKLIHKKDENNLIWTRYLFEKEPWDPSMYDLVVPSGKMDIDEAVKRIVENLGKDIIQPGDASKRAVSDFVIAADVEVALARKGHSLKVSADKGNITITIEKNVILLSKLEEELKAIAGKVPGVSEVTTKVGKNFYKADIYRKYDFEISPRVLLVDDERQFVQTMSERLLMREVGAHVVYDGEDALNFVKDEEPEVMVLDLKMPGVDGFEVLKRVKKTNPALEVIILTGHGSKEDETLCIELGAFAYLEKPLDIELLTKTMEKAYKKIKEKKYTA